MTILNLQNTVSTGIFGVEIKLEELGLKYEPRKFTAAILKLEKSTILIFQNGKFVVNGAKTEKIAYESAKEALLFILSKGYMEAKIQNFRITNMVFTGNMGFHINLYKIGPCNYEPELFPGAKITFRDQKLIMNVFASGKFVITGSDNFEDSLKAFESVRHRLENGRIGG